MKKSNQKKSKKELPPPLICQFVASEVAKEVDLSTAPKQAIDEEIIKFLEQRDNWRENYDWSDLSNTPALIKFIDAEKNKKRPTKSKGKESASYGGFDSKAPVKLHLKGKFEDIARQEDGSYLLVGGKKVKVICDPDKNQKAFMEEVSKDKHIVGCKTEL